MTIEEIIRSVRIWALYMGAGGDWEDLSQTILCRALGYGQPLEDYKPGYWFVAVRNEMASRARGRYPDLSLDYLLEGRIPEPVDTANVEAYVEAKELLAHVPGRTMRLALSHDLDGAQRAMLCRDRKEIRQWLKEDGTG